MKLKAKWIKETFFFIYLKWVFHFVEPGQSLVLGPNNHSISYIRAFCQRIKRIFFVRKLHLENTTLNKNTKVVTFYIEIFFFLLQNAFNTYYNFYYNYWGLNTKFWPGSTIFLILLFEKHFQGRSVKYRIT